MIDSIVSEVGKIAGKWIKDADAQAAFEHEIRSHPHIERLAQIDVNKEEAKHRSVFVAGWRPAVGWICALCLGWIVIGRDLLIAFSELTPDQLPTGNEPLVIGVLSVILGGTVGARTLEKIKGVAKDSLS